MRIFLNLCRLIWKYCDDHDLIVKKCCLRLNIALWVILQITRGTYLPLGFINNIIYLCNYIGTINHSVTSRTPTRVVPNLRPEFLENNIILYFMCIIIMCIGFRTGGALYYFFLHQGRPHPKVVKIPANMHEYKKRITKKL